MYFLWWAALESTLVKLHLYMLASSSGERVKLRGCLVVKMEMETEIDSKREGKGNYYPYPQNMFGRYKERINQDVLYQQEQLRTSTQKRIKKNQGRTTMC